MSNEEKKKSLTADELATATGGLSSGAAAGGSGNQTTANRGSLSGQPKGASLRDDADAASDEHE